MLQHLLEYLLVDLLFLTSGFLYNVISFPRTISVTEHTTVTPNMLDDIAYVKHEEVLINEDVDLTISDGDFIIFHWSMISINTINIGNK